MNLSTPIEEIPHVGPQYQKKLKKLGIKNVGQLLFHFPHRYEDFSNLVNIADVKEGGPAFASASAGRPFCFQGEITEIKNIRTFRKRMMLTQATLADETGKLKVMWFNQPYLINTFKKGTHLCLAGKITGEKSKMYLSNPAYEKINSNFEFRISNLVHTGRLIPVYPETEGLSSRWLRFIVKPLLIKLKGQIPDSLPERIRQKYEFLPLEKALWQIHFPDSLKDAQESKKRFGFEELFYLSLFIIRERMKLAKEKAIPIPLNLNLVKQFIAGLPFTLTNAQKKASWQILKDLEKPRPMNRLLEGDVGSGKTVVAAMASLNVVRAGYQVAFMAPTEILAKQHHRTMTNLLKCFNVKIGLITGNENYINEGPSFAPASAKASAGKKATEGKEKITRNELLEKVKNGNVDILIGTHAIIQDTTPKTREKTPAKFNNLALVIIDEQHRFGVEQRAKLLHRTSNIEPQTIPHFLSMTATPIPRTLSLTVYGDLDLSVIDEMPKGRKKIFTKIIQPKDKKATYEFIRKQAKEGRQAFVICPRIEPSSAPPAGGATEGQGPLFDERALSWMDVKAVKEEYEKLSKEIFPDLKVAMLHGKMRTEEKEKIMRDFKDKKIDVLVSTSVVEVGVDIPNASVMMIEGSEKFGLAQLHQFRGRVGRSNFQSYCFLFTDKEGIVYNRRLRALINCENGFELAEKDLQIRGPGDFSGVRQWGIPDLTMASLSDTVLVSKARNDAKELLQEDPGLKEYPLLAEKLREFQKRIHLE